MFCFIVIYVNLMNINLVIIILNRLSLIFYFNV